jgi:hypothetical protein
VRELARRAIHAGLEMDVAEAALAAAREGRAFAVAREIGDGLAARRVADHGADGKAQHDVLAALAVAIAPRPFSPLFARKMRV